MDLKAQGSRLEVTTVYFEAYISLEDKEEVVGTIAEINFVENLMFFLNLLNSHKVSF